MSFLEFELKSMGYFFSGILLTALLVGLVIFISISLNDVINISLFWSTVLFKSFFFAIAALNIMGWVKTIKFVKTNKEKVIVKTERGKSLLNHCTKTTLFGSYAFSILLCAACIRLMFS